MRLLDHHSFAEIVSVTSLRSCADERTLDGFEAVDQLEEIRNLGDGVLALVRMGRLSDGVAESLLRDLMKCFIEPRGSAQQLDEIKRIVRSHSE